MFKVKKISILKINTCITRNYVTSTTDKIKPLLTIEDMPHPRSLPIFGTKLNFLISGSGTTLHEYIDVRHKELGPIFHERLGGNKNLVFISDAELLKMLFINLEGKYPMHILPDPWILYEKLYGSKRGLFFMNGEEWSSNRRIMNKHLLREDTESWIVKPVHDTTANFFKKWKESAFKGSFTPNLETEFYRLSTDVLIKILLGTESSLTGSKHYEELLQLFSETVKKIFQTTTKLYGVPVNWCHRFNLKMWTNFKESVDLSLFLAQKIVNEILNERHESNGLIKKLCNDNLNNQIITRIVADFVIAAGDTTAYTSLWILYLLSNDDEIKNEIRKTDASYVKNIIKEAMRLYPVAPFLTRILPKECVLGQYKLNKGTPIIASIYTSGRDEQYFSKADKFLPFRWDRNDIRKLDLEKHIPSASLPFALGARSCIGKKIAMVQLSEIITQIVNIFDFKCTNSSEIKAITSQVLVPNKRIEISFSLRNSE